MTPPDRDHPLPGHASDRPIATGVHALSVELDDRHWREDNIEGWADGSRSLPRRLAEVLAGNLLLIGLCLGLMYVLTKLVT